MENKQDIGKAFRDKLDGYHKEPGDAVWQSINASLQQNKRGGFRIPLWGRATAIVLGVIMLAVFTHPMWEDYMPEIIIKMPNEKPDENSNGVTDTGTNADGTQPSDNSVTPTGTTEQGEGTNSTTTAGAPRSQDAATVSADDTNTNTAVPQNTTAAKNNASAKGGNASGKIGNNTIASSVAASDKKTKTGAVNTATAAASDKASGTNAKATGKASENNAVTSNKATGATKPSAKATAATTGITIANTVSAKVNSNSAASTTISGSVNNTGTVSSDKTLATGTSATAATNSTLPKNAATTAAGTTKMAGANPKNSKETNILYSSGNFPTITKAIADSLVLAQKAIDYKESKERTFAKPAYAVSDSLTGGDGYSKGFYAFAYIAPSNYKFGESTSVIDPSLNNSASSAETSTNFGAYIGYEFSSQFSVRVGVSSTKMAQNTSNVTLGGNYSGVDYANGMDNTTANVTLGGGPVTLRQKTTFIEVPFEATYAMFGTRADLYFKGGFSTLFLQDNELHAQNSQGSVLLGSLNTAKNFSLSGNLGIGFYYKFTRELQLNIEPGVKYYFNAFDNVSPWSLSVQAGLLYRF